MAVRGAKIDDDVLGVLSGAIVEGNVVRITEILDRELYLQVNHVLEGLGGKWVRQRRAHVFNLADAGSVRELLEAVMLTGEYAPPELDGYFPTPLGLVAELLAQAGIQHGELVLEPSAGRGAIAEGIRAVGGKVVTVELREDNRAELVRRAFHVAGSDFMTWTPGQLFDKVVMNPPFARQQDIDHVRRAYGFLRDGGRLVAIMAAGVVFRTDRKASEFREWLGERGAIVEPNDPDAFKPSGTSVRTVMVTIDR